MPGSSAAAPSRPPRLEVTERIAADGSVLVPLDEASVHRAAEACREAGVTAIAICLLHAFTTSAHERRVAEMLRAALPGIAITASVDVLPVVREYERSLAAILNAQVMPAVSTYVQRLERRLAEDGSPTAAADEVEWGVRVRSIRRAPAVPRCPVPRPAWWARGGAAAAGFRTSVTVDIGGTAPYLPDEGRRHRADAARLRRRLALPLPC